MDIAISCLARNNQVNIAHLFAKANLLNELVLCKSFFHSWNLCIKSNRYLTDLLVKNQVIRGLFSENPIIPNDIIRLEILTRLPLKSLVRFQCVCKSWQALISQDPVFIKSHLARTGIDPSNDWILIRCVLRRDTVSSNKFNYPNLLSRKLAGTVNGLVCVYNYDWSSKSVSSLGIWNPTTHQFKYVPPPLTASLVEVTDFFFAFGFDSIKNDYKVIYITTKHESFKLVADVYSCNADSWGSVSVSSSFVLDTRKHCQHIISLNDSVYWIHRARENFPAISFDIRHEVFRLLPSLDLLPNQKIVLVNWRNVLAYLVHDWVKTTYVDVYVFNETMSREGGTLTKMYTIGPITLTPPHMSIFQCFRNGDILFKDNKQFKLVRIDPETRAILTSSIHPYDTTRINLSLAFGLGYTETLAFVKGMQHKHININECARNLLLVNY